MRIFTLLFVLLISTNIFAQAPVANFSYSNGCVNSVVPFTDLTTNSPTVWDWNFGNGSTSNVQNPTQIYTSPGVYIVTLIVYNGIAYDTLANNISVYPLPSVNAGPDQTICMGSSTNLSAFGGTTYNWTPSTGLSSVNISNPIATPTATTNYTVTATDANGCFNNDMITITVNPLSIINLVKTDVDCFGDFTGQIDNTVTGGIPPYVYSWSNTETTEDISNLSAGTYTVNVTDINGCNDNNFIVISEPSEIIISLAPTDITCFGSTDGKVISTVNGGISPYSYSWSNGPTTQNITGLPTGNYILTVYDANACTKQDSTIIAEPLPSSVINGIINFQSTPVTAGIAQLIRKNGNLPADMILESTTAVNPVTGEFIFDEVTAGNYIVKVLGDTSIYNCAATYPLGTTQWNLAQEYAISSNCNDSIYLDIDLIELPSNNGPGTINGRLVQSGGGLLKAPGDPIPDIDITVDQSPGGSIFAATTTDSLGYFTITNLPLGTYVVKADMFGYGNDTLQTITFNGTDNSYDVTLCSNDTINMVDMCKMTITAVEKVNFKNLLTIYPNPAFDVVNINYDGKETLTIEVLDITGKKIISENMSTIFKTLNVADLQAGIYFIRLFNNDTNYIHKMIVQ